MDLSDLEIDDSLKEAVLAKHKESLSGYVSKEDFDAVNAKKDELLGESKKAKQKAREEAEAAEKARLEAMQKSGDVESLSKSYEEKLAATQAELDAFKQQTIQASKKDIALGFVSEHVVDDAFSREAMANEYMKRIDIRDSKPVVLDAEGNLTALSVDDLQKEFLSSSKYQAHLVSTKASGGSANGGKGSGSAAIPKTLSECKTKEQEIAYFEHQRNQMQG